MLGSRVLVTRKRPKRRRGDNEGTAPYWVLGWVTLSSVSEELQDNSGDQKRETAVVGGFLHVDRSLTEYEERIEKLKIRARELGPENGKGCTCLTDSLQILAYWDSQSNRLVGVDKTIPPPENVSKLPMLNNQRGYPWWIDQGESRPSSRVPPDKPRKGYDQVLIYEMNDDRLSFDHFACGFASSGTDWSLLIHRINHSNEILDIVQTGKFPQGTCPGQLAVTSEEGVHHISFDGSHGDAWPESSKSFHQQIQRLFVNNSLIILHLHHLRSMTPATSFLPSSIFSFFSIYRSMQTFLQLSSVTNDFHLHISTQCSKLCLVPSRSNMARDNIARWDAFLSATSDMIIGFFFCALLLIVSRNANFVGAFILSSKIRIFEALKEQIGWLETFPAGFKLNVQLTHNMGHEIRNLLFHQERMLTATLWSPQFCRQYLIPCLAAVAGAGGWTTVVAALVDLWRLENIHLIVLATLFRKLYQTELYLLSALFRLFRGKKRNPLRQRTDSMQYDAMQLLVGTVGFCICVFLWTTIMVYYTFFVVWNLAMHLPLVMLWILYSMNLSLPWGSLIWRSLRPGWFPKELYVEFLGTDSSSRNGKDDDNILQISRLVSIPDSPVHILTKHVAIHLISIFKWYLLAFLEVVVPRSSNSSPISMPLASLVENLNPWVRSTTANSTNTESRNEIRSDNAKSKTV